MDKKLNQERKELFYDSIALSWEFLANKEEIEKRLDVIFKFLLDDNLRNKSFLDIGAGIGIFACKARSLGAKVTAVELGPKLVRLIGKRCKVKTLLADAVHLPFPDESFDIVLSTEVIEHTRNPRKAVLESIRVLKPEGILVLTTPNKFWKFIFTSLSRLKIRPYLGNENWMSYHELTALLENSGMFIEKKLGFNFIIPSKKLSFTEKIITPSLPVFINFGFTAIKKNGS